VPALAIPGEDFGAGIEDGHVAAEEGAFLLGSAPPATAPLAGADWREGLCRAGPEGPESGTGLWRRWRL